MTYVFAEDGPVIGPQAPPGAHRIPVQPVGPESLPRSASLGPAMTPGKGLRSIRCVGCSRDTLPRPLDDAPLCHRCSELLAAAEPATTGWPAGPMIFRAPRWLRRRSGLD
jgi:hypothetical protein